MNLGRKYKLKRLIAGKDNNKNNNHYLIESSIESKRKDAREQLNPFLIRITIFKNKTALTADHLCYNMIDKHMLLNPAMILIQMSLETYL